MLSLTRIHPIPTNPAAIVHGIIGLPGTNTTTIIKKPTIPPMLPTAMRPMAVRIYDSAIPSNPKLQMPCAAEVHAINADPLPPYLKNIQSGQLPKLLGEIDLDKIPAMDEANFIYAVVSKMPEFLGLANLETTDFKDIKMDHERFKTIYNVSGKSGGAKLPTMAKPIVYGGNPTFSQQIVDVASSQGFDKAVQKVLTIFWALKGDLVKLRASGLSEENAASFSAYIKCTIQTTEDIVQMIYLSMAADFGKTAVVVSHDISTIYGADANHITAVQYFLRNPKLAKSSPTFRAMQSPNQQLETLQILFAEATGLNLGQGGNGENVASHWRVAEQLDLTSLKKLAAIYLIKLSGVIGNRDGIGILSDQLYTLFSLQLDALIKLKTGHYATAEEAFQAYQGNAAKILGYTLNDKAEDNAQVVTIVRLAMISKEFTPEGAQKIETALDSLPESDRQILIEAMSNDGVNSPALLLYLLPTMIGIVKKAYTDSGDKEKFYTESLKTLVRIVQSGNRDIVKDSESGVHLARVQPLQDAFNGKKPEEVIAIFENNKVGVRPGIFAPEFFWEEI